MNAKDLITLWGDAKNPLNEYACRQWSGLLNDFYKPRWELFFSRAAKSLNERNTLDLKKFNDEVSEWEWKWVNQRKNYPVQPIGNPVNTSIEMYQKYRKLMAIAH